MRLPSISQTQEDAWELGLAARNATADTVLANAETHPDREWVSQADSVHIAHAQAHLEEGWPLSDKDLEHAICRLSMALWLRQQAKPLSNYAWMKFTDSNAGTGPND